jgi:hypothetical protein
LRADGDEHAPGQFSAAKDPRKVAQDAAQHTTG